MLREALSSSAHDRDPRYGIDGRRAVEELVAEPLVIPLTVVMLDELGDGRNQGGRSVTTLVTTALFTPFTLSKLTLPNRIVMAPMTRSQSPGGVPGDDVVGYYRRRAEHGVGLIVTEGTAIAHPAAASSPGVPRFQGEEALAGWAKVVAAVHAAGGRIMQGNRILILGPHDDP